MEIPTFGAVLVHTFLSQYCTNAHREYLNSVFIDVQRMDAVTRFAPSIRPTYIKIET